MPAIEISDRCDRGQHYLCNERTCRCDCHPWKAMREGDNVWCHQCGAAGYCENLPADTWQTNLFGGPCAENVAEQGELFGSSEYFAKPVVRGPRIKDLPGQTMLF